MITREEVYRIGRIGKAHGVKGDVSFHFDDDIFDRTDTDYLVLEVDGILVPFFIEEYRFRNDSTAIIKFEGIDSEEQARELTHSDVFFPRNMVAADDEELSLALLVDFCIVSDDDNKAIGRIVGIDDSTVNILFEVETTEGEELLIPAVDEFITAIDTEKKTITMKLPEGLIE